MIVITSLILLIIPKWEYGNGPEPIIVSFYFNGMSNTDIEDKIYEISRVINKTIYIKVWILN